MRDLYFLLAPGLLIDVAVLSRGGTDTAAHLLFCLMLVVEFVFGVGVGKKSFQKG